MIHEVIPEGHNDDYNNSGGRSPDVTICRDGGVDQADVMILVFYSDCCQS